MQEYKVGAAEFTMWAIIFLALFGMYALGIYDEKVANPVDDASLKWSAKRGEAFAGRDCKFLTEATYDDVRYCCSSACEGLFPDTGRTQSEYYQECSQICISHAKGYPIIVNKGVKAAPKKNDDGSLGYGYTKYGTPSMNPLNAANPFASSPGGAMMGGGSSW